VAGVVTVKGSIASLKVAVMFPLIATPVAASAGIVELTVGAAPVQADTSVMASIKMRDVVSRSMVFFFH